MTILRILVGLLILTVLLFLPGANAFDGFVWAASGPPGSASITSTTSITMGPGNVVTFNYYYDVAGSFEPAQVWRFTATAPEAGTFVFDWSYNGFHGWSGDWEELTAFADGPSGTSSITLVPLCAHCVAHSFSFSGTGVSLQLYPGFSFGFIVQGANYDSGSYLKGSVKISWPLNAVGGVVMPVNAFTIFAPWLAVIGLVGCVGTVAVMAKKRRPHAC